ncbi:unnamed protein product, partial [Ectocarpus sp. 13 AM-2016]
PAGLAVACTPPFAPRFEAVSLSPPPPPPLSEALPRLPFLILAASAGDSILSSVTKTPRRPRWAVFLSATPFLPPLLSFVEEEEEEEELANACMAAAASASSLPVWLP